MERYGKFALLWCPACDVQFSDPMEEAGQAFYEQHEIYRRPETLYTSPRLLNWDQRSFLRDRPGQGGRLLDVGCGTGYFAAAARELGYRVSGLDLSRPQLELARTRFGLSDVHATTLFDYARTVPPHSFDVVTAFQVLEHVADPLAFLGDARRLLATGGHLAVGVPNWRVWRMLREPSDHPPHHLTRWSRHGLSRVLDRSGFEVLKIREHRSGYRFMLRQLRLGLLRRAMGGSGQAAGTKAVPSGAVMALSIAKTRTLMALDLPVQAFLTVIRAPAIMLYGLARVPE